LRILFVFALLISAASGQIAVEELGIFGGTGSAPGLFKNPTGIDIGEDGRVYVCDRGNHRIQVFNLRGNFLRNFGGFGSGEERFDEPLDIWARATITIYIADYNNQRVQRYNKDLTYISSKYSNPGDDERFQHQQVLSVAYSPQGNLFILDAGEFKVVKINAQDRGEAAFGYYESGQGELTFPVQIELTSNHRVVVSDAGADAVFYYDFFGNYLGQIKYPEFKNPAGIALDDMNRLYVADTEAQKIFIFSDFF